MLTLRQAAHTFDKAVFRDFYGTATFRGQLLPYPDSTISGSATRRRILEIDSSVSLPTKLTVIEQVSSQVFVISGPAYDFYGGDIIRKKYPILPVDRVYTLQTIDQLLANSGGTDNVYVSPSFVRRVVLEDQSEYEGGFELYFSQYYSVLAGTVVHGNGKYFKARTNSRIDDVGFGVVEAVEIYNPVSTVTYQPVGTIIDPSTSGKTPVDPVVNVKIFTEPAPLNYIDEFPSFEKIKPGDKAVSFLKSVITSAKAGDVVGGRRVLSATDMGLYWVAHTRGN